jgi:hypothetical protein
MQVKRRVSHRVRRSVAVGIALLALLALPAIASARPFDEPSPNSVAPVPSVSSSPPPASTAARDPSGYTLSIALAGTALVVAILGSGYVVIRLRGSQRRTVSQG